ncbi:MAG TPA: asparagine synthase (glutamine-hydrolyzing) [Pyrinomonadaceae bacterium]|nr:asparagine synthase (glutamine-hydrolyzing) [Pyrinomonadaceae bacterium]HMP64293.1 asparagine synthase (glutamine-hydrolyzing) [Pyrinomonadaceae bacterium]
MCGITGWINLKQSDSNHDAEAVLHSMCERIVHRGPDSEGLWLDDRVALGMRRLSIIDLKTGDQPVFNCDRSVVVMMNGELYNYREVRAELEKKGHKFTTRSDTEILPHLYEEYGEGLLDHINGMYAFSLWDTRAKKLIIARDRFGEKPLYYGVFDGKLMWASEPKAMLAHPSVKPELDLNALRHYISFDYVPAPMSIYQGIQKLPAAHVLAVENGEVKARRYWDLNWSADTPVRMSVASTRRDPNGQVSIAGGTGDADKSVRAPSEELKDLLSDAVRMRLVSDVPLGILLSGGIDSSTVAAFAVQHATERVKTFSIGFEEDSFDESKYARRVANHLNTEHYEDRLSAEKAGDLISEIGKWLDEPMSDGSLIPTYLLARFVRKHVTVALGGDGGDELFAGYPMYYGHKVAARYLALPAIIRSGLIEPLVNALPVSTKNLSFEYKAKRFVRASKYDEVARHHSWFGSFSLDQHEQLFTNDVLEHTDADVYRGVRELVGGSDAKNIIEQMQYADINYYLAEDILTKVDRAAMAVSLETRAPFLDPRIGQFAASIPVEYKLKGKSGKVILKEAMKEILPHDILHRPKKGFGIPIAEWLKGRLNPLMREMLSPDRLKKQGLFNAEYVQKLIYEHESAAASHHKELWTLLVFQIWTDNFVPNGLSSCFSSFPIS